MEPFHWQPVPNLLRRLHLPRGEGREELHELIGLRPRRVRRCARRISIGPLVEEPLGLVPVAGGKEVRKLDPVRVR